MFNLAGKPTRISRRGLFATVVLALALSCAASSAGAQGVRCAAPAATAVSVEGKVEVKRSDRSTWTPVAQGENLCPGDSLRVAQLSRAGVLLADDTLVRLDAQSTVSFSEIEPQESSFLDLLTGALHFISRTRRALKVRTPFVNAAIEGTEFALRVTPDGTSVWVYEGAVNFANDKGNLILGPGEAALAEPGRAPAQQIVVRPRDAVQWALYYPPLIDYLRLAAYTGPDQGVIEAAVAAYRGGHLERAFEQLTRLPAKKRTATFHVLRAALLLSVGQVRAAQQDLSEVLAHNPNSGDALALRAIIALPQNDLELALRLAREAVTADPGSPTPHIALSYVHQARFDIDQAVESTETALRLAPQDALVWSRLSELHLARGYVDRAVSAARKAATLDPHLSRTQSVLGFARLAETMINDGKLSFEKAIAADQAAPLPRLGLGLALIRGGALNAGVREIEIAASLDPDNSLIRSYLGKGYYEQKRTRLAAAQFAVAKQLDPLDPTPYFYGAILKQTTNEPVEALRDLQKAIALNDNRAVYRSRLLLDEDLAARTANIARIYDDLGFEQRALREGWRSINLDPANYSGHRFLADSYSALPRHEIARASELLQAQLLQPLNITPVQPRQAETNLFALEGSGPGSLSFNEFNPLFARNRAALQASGVIGDNNTWGDELILSGLWNHLSGSFGQYHFETDGSGDNTDIKDDILNAFIQTRLSWKHDFQFELRSRSLKAGDVRQTIRPEDAAPNLRRKIDEDSLRVGYHYSPSPGIDLIASVIHKDRDENIEDSVIRPVEFFGQLVELQEDSNVDFRADAWTAETQLLLQDERINTVVGVGYYTTDNEQTDETETSLELFDFVIPVGSSSLQSDWREEDYSGYVYTHLTYPEKLIWTIGFSADFFNNTRASKFDSNQFNPKLGLAWEVTEATSLRLAWFRTLKRPLAANQTIEPTQVAGFNQFFDDFNGTDARTYGVGIDQRFGSDVLGGLEYSARDLDVPLVRQFPGSNGTILNFTTEDRDETSIRGYLYWAATDRWSFSAEYFFEDLTRDSDSIDTVANNPKSIRTHRIPFGVGYYDKNGIFARGSVSYTDQKVDFPGSASISEDFWLVDAAIGYRLPKRLGIISVTARNLFNEDFRFQNTDLASDPRPPLFEAGRSVFLNVSLSL